MASVLEEPKEVMDLMDRQPGQALLTDRQWLEAGEALGLSIREQDVCRLLFEGNTRQEIADRLGIKSRTIRHHMEQLHEKLRVRNRVGVVLRIVEVRDELTAQLIPRHNSL